MRPARLVSYAFLYTTGVQELLMIFYRKNANLTAGLLILKRFKLAMNF